mmetsp:Transcript_17959/g.52067  ORF Transcript_17959/g.52067 Transcript_17959/m.52067 type:complete len:230 (+) Transcript_17959:663-1352(+)
MHVRLPFADSSKRNAPTDSFAFYSDNRSATTPLVRLARVRSVRRCGSAPKLHRQSERSEEGAPSTSSRPFCPLVPKSSPPPPRRGRTSLYISPVPSPLAGRLRFTMVAGPVARFFHISPRERIPPMPSSPPLRRTEPSPSLPPDIVPSSFPDTRRKTVDWGSKAKSRSLARRTHRLSNLKGTVLDDRESREGRGRESVIFGRRRSMARWARRVSWCSRTSYLKLGLRCY